MAKKPPRRVSSRPASIRSRRDGHAKRNGKGASPEAEALHRAVGHCHSAFAYCATEADEVQDLGDLLCLADCAQICTVAAEFIMRGSIYSDMLRDVCYQMCTDAAETCAAYPGDEVLSACADVLRDACDVLAMQMEPAE